MVECEVYLVEDIMVIMNVARSTACNMIKHLNDELIKKGTPKKAIVSGRISKKYFRKVHNLD